MEENKVNLLECFYSIDGETKRSGELVWFIRLTGCNLNCIWCDTNYCHKSKGTKTDINDLVDSIKNENNCKKVTITGGEPLIHKNVDKLILKLLEEGYNVNIETNGSIDPNKVLDFKKFNKYRSNGQLWYSLDYKCTGSHMNDRMISASATSKVLGKEDCLKFVVASKEDLEEAYHRIKLVERYYNERKESEKERCTYYISPCFGQIKLPSIIDFMKEKNLVNRVRFQLQQHKIIWNPKKRGV